MLVVRVIFKAFALTGRKVDSWFTQGECPGLGASAPSGRVGWLPCKHELLGHIFNIIKYKNIKEIPFCVIFLAENFVLSIIICIFASSVPTKPLNDAQMRGAFLYIYVHSQNTLMERLPHFMKHYMTEADLMALLKSRGLVISDEDKAVRYLESIGYYRLSAYMYPFLKVPKETHQYKDGTTFQQVLNLYRFDKKLRMLLLNEIEKVEIAIRRAIMNIPVFQEQLLRPISSIMDFG